MTLSELALKHGTDKGPQHHNYTPIYERYFEPLRHQRINLLEIGVGGYHYPDRGGQSLRMWREYFTHAQITGFDIHPKELDISGVQILQGSQTDAVFLSSLPYLYDIIIDDGSHINEHILFSFSYLFNKLKSGGIYVVEDTETSYWSKEYGGSTSPIATTTMNYFKRLADTLNPESGIQGFGIETIHFYKGMIFIIKK